MGVYALDSHKKAFTAFIFKAIMERCLFRAIERDGTVELVGERSHELHVKRRMFFHSIRLPAILLRARSGGRGRGVRVIAFL